MKNNVAPTIIPSKKEAQSKVVENNSHSDQKNSNRIPTRLRLLKDRKQQLKESAKSKENTWVFNSNQAKVGKISRIRQTYHQNFQNKRKVRDLDKEILHHVIVGILSYLIRSKDRQNKRREVPVKSK